MGLFDNIKVKDEKIEPVIKPMMVDVVEPVDVKTRQESSQPIQEPDVCDDINVKLFEFKKNCVVKVSRNYTKQAIVIEYTPQNDDMMISFQRIYEGGPSSKVTEYKFSSSRLPIKYTLYKNGYEIRINVILLTYDRDETKFPRCLEAYEITLP